MKLEKDQDPPDPVHLLREDLAQVTPKESEEISKGKTRRMELPPAKAKDSPSAVRAGHSFHPLFSVRAKVFYAISLAVLLAVGGNTAQTGQTFYKLLLRQVEGATIATAKASAEGASGAFSVLTSQAVVAAKMLH